MNGNASQQIVNKAWNYKGQKIADGCFELTCDAKKGRASLHMLRDSVHLDGYWTEDSGKGMWRITLGA